MSVMKQKIAEDVKEFFVEHNDQTLEEVFEDMDELVDEIMETINDAIGSITR